QALENGFHCLSCSVQGHLFDTQPSVFPVRLERNSDGHKGKDVERDAFAKLRKWEGRRPPVPAWETAGTVLPLISQRPFLPYKRTGRRKQMVSGSNPNIHASESCWTSTSTG